MLIHNEIFLEPKYFLFAMSQSKYFEFFLKKALADDKKVRAACTEQSIKKHLKCFSLKYETECLKVTIQYMRCH